MKPVVAPFVSIGLFLFFGAAASLNAQDNSEPPMVLPRITSPITLDGMSDEPAWQAIEPLPVSMLYPTYQGEMTETTEIRVAYDQEYLYASIRAYHENTRNLRANTYVRDRWGEDDEFTLVLDTFYDRENAMMFMVNPTGNRIDFLVFNDAEPNQGSYLNRDWNTFWDAEAVITDRGWFAEMRIPFSSLQFNVRDNGE
ncbi:MAG: carbohydrate binding family 9 domain-containing protein, partial [Balneolaceae bacterium]|nr:carbohydrate binding family 9 domain-containing protein [Balneolaceae bacterium]